MCTQSISRDAAPEVAELTLETARLLEELGHRVTVIDNPVPARFIDDFLLYWSFLAFALVRGGRRTFGRDVRPHQAGQPDARARRGRRAEPAQAAVGDRAAGAHRGGSPHGAVGTYDVVLMPTLADETPRIGHLDPTADYEQIIDRLIDWVAFTPLQNATGEPAISLPLAQSASGLPVGMMCRRSGVGEDARLLELAYELEEARPWRRLSD